ncbi:MAG: hypothetical protein AAFO95_12155 [Cyanobacteria bacterium J06600_6]
MVDSGKIVAQIVNLETAQELVPIWTKEWGVKDRGVLIHSLGVTYFTLLGNRLNYVSVTEVPAPCEGKYACVGNEIRSDAVWFNPITQAPIAIAEFERCSGKEDNLKLENKVKNLLLAHHRWSVKAELLILAYWTKKLTSLNSSKLQQIIHQGFVTPAGENVAGSRASKLFLFQFVMREERDLLYLADILTRENK